MTPVPPATLSHTVVELAIGTIAPAVLALFESELFTRKVVCGSVVIRRPRITHDGYMEYGPDCFHNFQFGDLPQEQWSAPYMEIARAKAQLAHRCQRSAREIISMFPHKLRSGDVMYPGGVFTDGIASGASGVQSHFDEMIAKMVNAAIVAVAHGIVGKKIADSNAPGVARTHYFDFTQPAPVPGKSQAELEAEAIGRC